MTSLLVSLLDLEFLHHPCASSLEGQYSSSNTDDRHQ